MNSGGEAKRTVFLVHGRDDQARASLDALLRAFDLKVITWRRAAMLAGSAAPFTRDIVAAGIKHADAVVVLLTPDDVGYLRPKFLQDRDGTYERVPTGQPRMNVLFEAGMAMAQHEKKVVLVEVGAVRRMSDIDGVNVVRLDNRIESRKDLAYRLASAGLTIDMEDDAWREAGSFSPATLRPEDLAPAGAAVPPSAVMPPHTAASSEITAGEPTATAARHMADSSVPGVTPKQQAYLKFWQAFLDHARTDATLAWVRARKARSENWVVLEQRQTGSFVVSFVSGGRLRCEYYIDNGDGDANLRLLRELESSQAGIEGLFGGPLSWEELPGRRACRVAAYTDGQVIDPGKQEEYIKWFTSAAMRLRDALGSRVV